MSETRFEIHTTIDGEPATLVVGAHEPAIHALRSAGHRGCKLACGQGACGACAVQLDGEPVVSCLLPAAHLRGRHVTTVAGLARDGALHPVQRSFMAHDALQCGYCTPGFLVRAAAFHDRWRAERPGERPGRDRVAAELAGHLCRCGAYDAIFAAVAAACAGEHDQDGPLPPRREAREKVTGRARYTVDVVEEGMLHGRILRSPHAHARITRLDTRAAEAIDGVRALARLTTKSGIVRYAGQEILAIAAVDEACASRALRAVEIEYEVLPAVLDMDAARAPGAPAVYEPKKTRRDAPNASEGPLGPLPWTGNVRGPFWFFSQGGGRAKRNVERARRGEPGWALVEGTYRTQAQCHNCLEPHAAVAAWRDGALTVWLSTQAVHRMAADLAARFELPRDRVTVLAEHVGGAFGSKAGLTAETIAAVELAKKAGAPVRVVLDRREELTVGGLRPAEELHLAIAADANGDIGGISLTAYGDAGVAVGNVTSALFRIMYEAAPRSLSDYDVTTHTPPGKPFRGPGGPPAFFALESAIDELALARGEDPLRLRRRWDRSEVRHRLYDWVESLEVWRTRPAFGEERGRYRRGVGLSSGGWFYFVQPGTEVEVDVGPDGLVARTASQDIGNGTRTAIATAVGEVFGLSPHDVEVELGDSRFVEGPFSGGSRTTASVVPAAHDAASWLRARLAETIARTLGLRGAHGSTAGVVHAGGTVPWPEVFRAATPLRRVGKRKTDRGGFFLPFRIEGLSIGKFLGAAVQVTEVEVDVRLGKVRPLGVWAGVGVGRIVSPVLAASQVRGAVVQGFGYALYEERRIDPVSGRTLTVTTDDYRIPGIGDCPPIEVHFDQSGFDDVQSGTVGLGEVVAVTPPASVANAIAHATGWRPRELPIRPDRVVTGVAS